MQSSSSKTAQQQTTGAPTIYLGRTRRSRLEDSHWTAAVVGDSASSGSATASGSLSRTAKENRSGYQQAQQCQQHYHYYREQYHDQSLTRGRVVHLPDAYHAKIDPIKRQKPPDERYPANQRRHRRVGSHPEGGPEPRVVGPHDQPDHQVRDASHDEDADSASYRGENHAPYE